MDEILKARPTSLWMGTTATEPKPTVEAGARFDIAIIGAGVVGVMTAYNLRKSGLAVAVIEAGSMLSDVTGNTTGKLTSQHDLIYKYLLDNFGFEFATKYYEANEWAIRTVAEISVGERIACDFEWDDAHVFCTKPEHLRDLQEEADASAKLGVANTFTSTDQLPFPTEGVVRMTRQARFHPRKFLLGLVERAEQAGVGFYENSRAIDVKEREDEVEIETEHGIIHADIAVVATHYPIHDSGLFVAKLAPYRSYAMAIDIEGPMPEGMYISHQSEALRSLRRAKFREQDVLIVGGEMHKVGQEDDTAGCFQTLELWARQNFRVREVLFKWSTQDNFTVDRVPYIGLSPNRERIYMATGFNGWGMTSGVIAGKLISDLVLDQVNSWEEVFRPSRMDLAMIPKLVKENVNTAGHLIGDRVKSVDRARLDMLASGKAAVLQTDQDRIAAYRDPDGILHVVSPACTHMGCQVKWNEAETSWDCPCHGSRFDIDGNVLHGPAVKPLARREIGTDLILVNPELREATA